MHKYLSTHPDFITAFAETCYLNNFTEKQASELFDTYAKAEFLNSDNEFSRAFNATVKQATTVAQALKTLGSAAFKGSSKGMGYTLPAALGLGAGVASGSGLLPSDASGGLTTGLGVGAAAAGLMGAVKNPALAYKALSRVGNSSIKQMPRTIAGIASSPAFINKGLKPAAKLTAQGAVLGGAMGVGQQLRNGGIGIEGMYPKLDPNTGVNSEMMSGAQAPQGGGNASFDPYDLPGDIVEKLKAERGLGGAGGGAQAAGALGATPEIVRNREQLTQLDSQISQLQNSVPTANNPASYMQQRQVTSQLDLLKKQRSAVSAALVKAEQLAATDQQRMQQLTAERLRASTKGLNTAQNEYSGLQSRLDTAQNGGLLGKLMGLYNKATGAEGRMRELDPIYRGYNREIENARNIQARPY
jgi:hypothetical protein